MVMFDEHSWQVLRNYAFWVLSTAAIIYAAAAVYSWNWCPSDWGQGVRLWAAVLWALAAGTGTLVAVIECTTSDSKVRNNA